MLSKCSIALVSLSVLIGVAVLLACGPLTEAQLVLAAANSGHSRGLQKKWNPGHYMETLAGDANSLVTMQNRLNEIEEIPEVQGVVYRMNWDLLESDVEGVYTFEDLDAVVAHARSMDKHVFVLLRDRTFNETDVANCPVPSYVLNLGGTNMGCAVHANNTVVARFWREDVMDRIIALDQAICERYENNPWFHGIITEESTASPGSSPVADYSESALVTQLLRRYAAASQVCVKTLFLASLNFPTNVTSMAQLVNAVDDARLIGLSGPDLCPGDADCLSTGATTAQEVYLGTEGSMEHPAFDYRGRFAAAMQVQAAGVTADMTAQELYDHAENVLEQNFQIWTRITATGGGQGATANWANIVLPMLQDGMHPVTHVGCPTNYRWGCKASP